MNQFWKSIENFFKVTNFRKTIKISGFFIVGIVAFFLIFSGAVALYFNNNKAEIITQINAKINDNITGRIDIGDIRYKFLKEVRLFFVAE